MADMIRLIYCSSISTDLTQADLETLVHASAAYNTAYEITGILVFRDKFFLQVLEGERSQVMALFTKISTDARHQNIQILSESAITRRQFPNWAMELISSLDSFYNRAFLDSYDPYTFTASQALDFAIEAKAWRLKHLHAVL